MAKSSDKGASVAVKGKTAAKAAGMAPPGTRLPGSWGKGNLLKRKPKSFKLRVSVVFMSIMFMSNRYDVVSMGTVTTVALVPLWARKLLVGWLLLLMSTSSVLVDATKAAIKVVNTDILVME